MNLKTLITEPEKDYELLDSGDGEKLERYGAFLVSRPDPQALWKKTLPESEWEKAHAKFLRTDEKAGWKMAHGLPVRWDIAFGGLKFWIRPTSFKHTGLFPEQSQNWKWIGEQIAGKEKIKVLNLFGYTGGATLAALAAGAEVTHVDGSKVALQWAKDNAELSALADRPVRWLLDDAFAFVEREIRRGNTYDAIMMDPPSFGHGPKGEVWKIEEKFVPFLDACKKLLAPNPLFIIINGYSSGYSALSYANALADLMKSFPGAVSVGELAIRESASKKLLPSGIFARWSSL